MCGRFSLISNAQLLAKILQLNRIPTLEPRYNIAPTQLVPVVRKNPDSDEREMDWLRWGLIPFWVKDKSIGGRMINAKSETVFQKPAYRTAIKQRRCLIPADGFFEWQKKSNGKKQPYYVRMKNETPFVFAGLWEHWQGEDEEIESFSILTTDANELIRPLHDRMPVILNPDDYDLWLDTEQCNKNALQSVLKPYPSDFMKLYPVNPIVNSPVYDGPECIEGMNA